MIPKKLNIKSSKEFERRIYDINKKVWHADKLCELDHTRGRNGVRLCCPVLWAQAGAMHEDNILYKKAVREIYRPMEREVLKNYIKGIGCKARIYKPCQTCAMPEATEHRVAEDQRTGNNAPGAIVETNSEDQNADNK